MEYFSYRPNIECKQQQWAWYCYVFEKRLLKAENLRNPSTFGQSCLRRMSWMRRHNFSTGLYVNSEALGPGIRPWKQSLNLDRLSRLWHVLLKSTERVFRYALLSETGWRQWVIWLNIAVNGVLASEISSLRDRCSTHYVSVNLSFFLALHFILSERGWSSKQNQRRKVLVSRIYQLNKPNNITFSRAPA